MKISSKARSAVMAMVQLAQNSEQNKHIALSNLLKADGLSLVFLEQIFSNLKKNGLVISHRGLNGGYSLAKSSSDISILDIIQAVDPVTKAVRCDSAVRGCRPDGEKCSTHNLWDALDHMTQSFLQNVTLYDVAFNHLCRSKTEGNAA